MTLILLGCSPSSGSPTEVKPLVPDITFVSDQRIDGVVAWGRTVLWSRGNTIVMADETLKGEAVYSADPEWKLYLQEMGRSIVVWYEWRPRKGLPPEWRLCAMDLKDRAKVTLQAGEAEWPRGNGPQVSVSEGRVAYEAIEGQRIVVRVYDLATRADLASVSVEGAYVFSPSLSGNRLVYAQQPWPGGLAVPVQYSMVEWSSPESDPVDLGTATSARVLRGDQIVSAMDVGDRLRAELSLGTPAQQKVIWTATAADTEGAYQYTLGDRFVGWSQRWAYDIAGGQLLKTQHKANELRAFEGGVVWLVESRLDDKSTRYTVNVRWTKPE